MMSTRPLWVAAVLSVGAWVPGFVSPAHACAVDAVAGKTDTSITISWDLSKCDHVNSGKKFEICWKHQGHGGNACIPPTHQDDSASGSYTITGLSPSTPYRIKTQWHKRSAWHDVTSRVVSTDPTPTSTATSLRYEKGTGQKYCVTFYWRNPPTSSASSSLSLVVSHRSIGALGGFNAWKQWDVTGASRYPPTGEYAFSQCVFSNNQSYRAHLVKTGGSAQSIELASNELQWK